MADFVARSQQNIHEWSNVYGPGYAPEYFGGTSRFTITRTPITKMSGSALLGECTFTITFKSNNTEDPTSQRNSGYNYAVDYEVYIAGARRGTARLVSRTQYINKNTTYVRTLKATNIPLGTATTVSAYIRTVNDRPSSQALLFDSRNQGGDSLSGLPLGIQTANFTSFSNFTIVNAPTRISASVTARSSGVTHNVRLKHGTVTVMSWSGLGNFTTLEVTQTQAQTLLNRLSTVTSASVTLEVDTIHGGRTLYTQSRTASVTVGIGPSIGAVGISDSSGALSEIGALVQNISNVTLSINNVVPGYGTTVNTYGFEWMGQSYSGQTSSSIRTGIVNQSGSQTFTGRMSNKRGQVATRSRTDTILPWAAPRSTSVQVRRCTSNGTLDPTGGYIRVTGTHSVSPLKVGSTNKNTLRVLVRYRATGTTTWTTPLNKTYPAGTVSTSEAHTLGGGALDPTKTYDFEVYSFDRYTNTRVTGLIPTERVLISKVRNEGVGFGKIRERGIVDAKGDVYIDGDLNVTGELDLPMFSTSNLVIDSQVPIHASRDYLVKSYNVSEEWIPNQLYTLSVKGSFTQTPRFFANGGMSSFPVPTKIGPDIWAVTASRTSFTNDVPMTLRVYNWPNTSGQAASIEWVMVQKGSIRTDHSPAPQSLVEKVFFRVGGEPYVIPIGFNQQKIITCTTNVTDRAFFGIFTKFGDGTPVATVIKDSSHVTYTLSANAITITPAYSAHGLVLTGIPSESGV